MLEKIDQVFINLAWESIFPSTTVTSFTKFVSDYVPLVILVNTMIMRPAIFALKISRPAARTTLVLWPMSAPRLQTGLMRPMGSLLH